MRRLLSLAWAIATVSWISWAQTPLSFSESNLVCSNGLPHSGALEGTKPRNLPVWGTACPNAEGASSTIASTTSSIFPAPAILRLHLAGYPSGPGNRFSLESVYGHDQLTLQPLEDPGLSWQPYEFSLPRAWHGVPVRFAVEHSPGDPEHFFGFTNPVPGDTLHADLEALVLLVRTLVSWLFLFLPGVFLAFLSLQNGCKDPLILGCTILAGVAGWGYLTFWLWFLSPLVGNGASLAFSLLWLACVPFGLRRLDASDRRSLGAALIPVALTGALALLVLSTGFLYGGMDSPSFTASVRFSHPLPYDNQLPYVFATAVAGGHIPKPLAGEWLSSDRPPLQTGIYLAQYAVARGRFGYTVAGVLCQCLWIFALWLLLLSLELHRSFIRLALPVCACSGFVFLNCFYVWPKLLAAAYTLAFALFFLSRRYRLQLTSGPWIAALAGSLLAFAMLSHGGTVFAIIGLFCAVLLLRDWVPWRTLAFVILTAGILYLPWMAYQRFLDPPGNHLLKMHLAGVSHADSRSLAETLYDQYRLLTFQTWLVARVDNAATILGPQFSYWRDVFALMWQLGQRDFSKAHGLAIHLRTLSFFYFVPCLGPLMVGPVALLALLGRRRRVHDVNIAVRLWLFVGTTLVVWCLLMFSGGSTVLHQGSYAVVLLVFCGALLALWAASPMLASVFAAANIALNVLLYVACMRPPALPGVILSGRLHYPTAVLGLASLGLIFVLLQGSAAGYEWTALRAMTETYSTKAQDRITRS